MAQRLFVDGVQQDMTGPVGRIVGARGAVAAKTALGDAAVRRAAEDAAHVLVGVDDVDGLLDHDLDGILVAQPVRPLDGVEHVQFPAVDRAHRRAGSVPDGPRGPVSGNRPDIVQCGGDAALGRAAVRAQRVDLGQHADIFHALLCGRHGGPGSGQAGADDDHIMGNCFSSAIVKSPLSNQAIGGSFFTDYGSLHHC